MIGIRGGIEMSDEYNAIMELTRSVDRIAEALEKLNTNLLPILAKGIGNILREETILMRKEGEKSVPSGVSLPSERTGDVKGTDQPADSYPLPKTGQIQWIFNEGRKYKDCKFCENLVSWNHDTNNYDHFNRGFKYLYPKCNIGGG